MAIGPIILKDLPSTPHPSPSQTARRAHFCPTLLNPGCWPQISQQVVQSLPSLSIKTLSAHVTGSASAPEARIALSSRIFQPLCLSPFPSTLSGASKITFSWLLCKTWWSSVSHPQHHLLYSTYPGDLILPQGFKYTDDTMVCISRLNPYYPEFRL